MNENHKKHEKIISTLMDNKMDHKSIGCLS